MNEVFRKQLAKMLGRKPTEAEVKEAFERITRINRLLAEVREGRNGMRLESPEKAETS